MKILTETMLRAAVLAEHTTEYCVESDVFVTPLAKEYLQDRGITLTVLEHQPAVMTRTPLDEKGQRKFVDAVTGEGYSDKPESMTHLRANMLVSKTHPQIAFRGMLDSLQAMIISIQAKAAAQSKKKMVEDLGDILSGVRCVLGAEVKDEPVPPVRLLGLTDLEIREHSHNVKKYIGIDHPVPDYTMGAMAAELNLLRTKVRETELAAARAFILEDGTVQRNDIIQLLNRLSSAVYIIFCNYVAGHY